ncbi:MAG TPA: hypothetical protein DD420_28990 [Streptomyces sp.]|nr:hypothetical protein [Streptomyces sp.]
MVDAGNDDEPIGRCYTKARRAPLVHGVIRDVNGGRGIRLPGGPYTLTQLATIVSTCVVLILTRPVWGGHGFLDAVILLVLPFAAAFLLRHLHIDGRNPAAALVSVAAMLGEPRWGRLHGRPFRPARPVRQETRTTLCPRSSTRSPAPAARTAPAVPAAARTAPATRPHTPVPSGAQALLVRRTDLSRKEA